MAKPFAQHGAMHDGVGREGSCIDGIDDALQPVSLLQNMLTEAQS